MVLVIIESEGKALLGGHPREWAKWKVNRGLPAKLRNEEFVVFYDVLKAIVIVEGMSVSKYPEINADTKHDI